MATSHIGLLPTYNDSYGYSVIEFFSYGCPVITTNILALPEINQILLCVQSQVTPGLFTDVFCMATLFD